MVRLLVIALVLAEIASLILVGQAAGVLLTLLLVVLAALAGAGILKRQGSDAIRGMRGALSAGRDPRPALLRGGFRLIAALLLIVPGFLGDAVALLLLLPPVQKAAAQALARRSAGAVRIVRTTGFDPMGRPAPPARDPSVPPARDGVEDAEWEELAPGKRPTHRPSGWTRH
jgi:UPF0716 protein FxsA